MRIGNILCITNICYFKIMKGWTSDTLKKMGLKETADGVFSKTGKEIKKAKPVAAEKKKKDDPRNPGVANKVSRQEWAEIGGQRKYFRSLWEKNFCYYLQWQKERGDILDWQHEPDTFWFEGILRGVRSYLPDFKVYLLHGGVEYFEVKGYMDSKSVTKLARMKKYHPTVVVNVIDADWFKENGGKLCGLIPGWAKG